MVNRAIFVFSLLGLFVSSFLAYEYSISSEISCPITGLGCELVRKSEYSNFLGISIPYLGIVFYLIVGILSIILSNRYIKKIKDLRFLISFTGVGFGVYLTLIEAFIIKAYCIWCITSFIISLFIFVLVLLKDKKYMSLLDK